MILMSDIKLFAATKALISHNGKILLIQESSKYKDGSQTGKFDVVGGRVTPGEHFEESLKREILEETGMNVKIGAPFFVNESWPIVRDEKWQVIRIFFETFSEDDKVTLSEDHENYIWIDPKDYKNYPIIENLIPVFEAYLSRQK
jgi:8-oxo-dGTP diphosphatase